ncbi:MAG: hypothetical protein WBA43_22600 [Elainellaceae cyanobacterium]|jgi:hypothetical protein|uniref:Dethiobiotin synthetase n=1 Tax=Leptolyngbya sp. CCY15150 TaxID=2767772 RepID=UPI001EF16AA6|nr:Dethiobiotin synthetase [Leptolyngbya sp. CCY15150]
MVWAPLNLLVALKNSVMDYETAHHILLTQGQVPAADPNQFLMRLQTGRPPVPGQVTTILLALKVIFEELREVPTLDRDLANALYQLAGDSRRWYDQGRQQGLDWPPLLDEDLQRIAIAVRSIFADTWHNA